ncbi:MAG TPA: DUF4124 domain-containing protein [Stenotrophomonas sp.]|jgi:hypothetical protein
MRAWLLPLILIAPPVLAADTPPAGNVRVYRCVDDKGTVSLQDSPCGQGRQQQVLDMQRPQDPPPRVATTAAPADSAADAPASKLAPREVRIVHVAPAQPMYECITEEGERYTSDTPDGNPRWVPTWTYGYASARPGLGPRPGPRPGGGGGGGGGGPGGPGGHGPDGGPRPPRPPGGHFPNTAVIVPYGSMQVRDECHALPQQEVCARLRDRRWELIRGYNSALQSERERLSREQRGVDARLDQDCGGA